MSSMDPSFDLQGHRGARGFKPENTLPSFEVAFDLGVTTVETDLHLTADGVPVLIHDPGVSGKTCRLIAGKNAPDPAAQPAVSSLRLDQIRGYRADRNPDPARFAMQNADVTPLARLFADSRGIDPYTPPSLEELFAFAEAYAGELGKKAGKTETQRAHARIIRFDLELKRVPFRPELIGDGFDGEKPGLLEQRLVEIVRRMGMVARTIVRSFDHRCVRILRQMEPGMTGAVLIAETAPLAPEDLVRKADAQVYCPDYQFLDEAQVRRLHAADIKVVPWTVNEPADWQRLLAWGVDGMTTDYPDRLADFLKVGARRGLSPPA